VRAWQEPITTARTSGASWPSSKRAAKSAPEGPRSSPESGLSSSTRLWRKRAGWCVVWSHLPRRHRGPTGGSASRGREDAHPPVARLVASFFRIVVAPSFCAGRTKTRSGQSGTPRHPSAGPSPGDGMPVILGGCQTGSHQPRGECSLRTFGGTTVTSERPGTPRRGSWSLVTGSERCVRRRRRCRSTTSESSSGSS
jgi:hypothetical protein